MISSPSDNNSNRWAPTGGAANQNNESGGGRKPGTKSGKNKKKNKNKNNNNNNNNKNAFKGGATEGALHKVVVTQHNHREGASKLIKALGQVALEDKEPKVNQQLRLKGGPQAVTEDMVCKTTIDETTPTTKHKTTQRVDLEGKAWMRIQAYQETLHGRAWAQINGVVQAEMEATTNFTTTQDNMDLIGMLRVLKQVCNRGSFGGSHDEDILIAREQKNMLLFRQRPDEDASAFAEKLKSRYDNLTSVEGTCPLGNKMMESVIAQVGGITLERYSARVAADLDLIARCDKAYKERVISTLLILQGKSTTLLKKLEEALLLGNNAFPKKIPDAVSMMLKHEDNSSGPKTKQEDGCWQGVRLYCGSK